MFVPECKSAYVQALSGPGHTFVAGDARSAAKYAHQPDEMLLAASLPASMVRHLFGANVLLPFHFVGAGRATARA